MAGEGRLADCARVVRAWPVRAGGVLRCIVAALLLVAAGLEAYQLATEPIAGTGILSARWFRIGWAEFELFLGVWLLTGVYPRLSWLTALGCFMVFSGVTLAKALDGQDSCGCFGKVEVNPWYTFTLDVSVVLGMLALRGGGYSPRPGAGTRRRAGVGLGCALVVGALAALAMGSYQPTTVSADGELVGDSGIVLLEPEAWVGGRFPLLGHVTVGEKLSHGRWIVVLFARGCPGCAEALPRYQKMASGSEARGEPAVALVEIPRPHRPDAPEPARQAGMLWGRLDDRKDWFVTTPVVLLLADGVVKAAWEGKAPPWDQLVRGLR